MKHIFALLLCATLTVSLLGCGHTDNPPTTTSQETTETTAPTQGATQNTTPIITPEQKPMVAVSLPVITETTTSGKTILFKNVYQNIELILPEPEVAEKVILDFLIRTDTGNTADTICAQAEKDYKSTSQYWNPYLCQITYDPMRIDGGILSLYGSHITYDGAAHAGVVNKSVSYDLVTGEVLSLDQVLTNISTDELYTLVLASLNDQKEAEQLYIGFESTVKERFSKDLSSERDWFFSDEGLCFFFSTYEISPYASGDVVATVPYEKLAGKMDDAYFPAEQDITYGTIRAEVFTDKQLDAYTQMAEVTLDAEGSKIVIYTDLSVQNVQIELGSWSADGAQYTPSHKVFASPALTPGDGIVLQCSADGLPALRISYLRGGELCYAYISLNQQNNTVSIKG